MNSFIKDINAVNLNGIAYANVTNNVFDSNQRGVYIGTSSDRRSNNTVQLNQFFKVSNEPSDVFSPYHSTTWGVVINYSLLYLLALCAFITNISREIIKDIQDMKGDQEIRVRSLPMLVGEIKAYWIATFIAQLSLLSCTISYIYFRDAFSISNQAWAIIFVSASLNVLLVILPFVRTSDMKQSSLLLKISLFIGVCSLYFS